MQVFNLQDALSRPEAVESLHLDRCGLEDIPASIAQLVHLKELNLRGNHISDLPDWLPALTNLQKLDLRENRLRKVNADWFAWRSLEVVNLSNNLITSVRGWKLPDSLRELYLSNNRLQSLAVSTWPAALERLHLLNNKLKKSPNLRDCTHLTWLNVHYNLLTEFPELPPGIQFLDVSKNKISCIPANLPFPQLEVFNLADNQLKAIPPTIRACHRLRTLDLSGNQLRDLPKEAAQLNWLIQLRLDQNQLEKIPKVVNQLSILDVLTLSGNQLQKLDLDENLPLRLLNIADNPIKKIGSLPNSIQSLDLKKTAPGDWTFLRKLQRLETLEVPASFDVDLLRDLCYLPALQHLSGLLPYGKKKKLLSLLQQDLSAMEKLILAKYWVVESGEKVESIFLQKALQTNITSLQQKARADLLAATQESEIPAETKEVGIIGKLQTKPEKLSLLFADKAVQIDPNGPDLILGRPPIAPFEVDNNYRFFSEAQLLVFLRKQTGNQIVWQESEILNLQKRLVHANPQQIKLALLLLADKSVPKVLIPYLILSWKLQEEPGLKKELGRLVRQYCPPEFEPLRRLSLPDRSQRTEVIEEWLKKSLSFRPK